MEKQPIRAFAHPSTKTSEFAPAIEFSDGSFTTYSPTSFDEERAQQIAEQLMVGMKNSELSDAEMTRRGELIAEVFQLKKSRDFPDRYFTEHGTKSAIGVFLTMKRLIEKGE